MKVEINSSKEINKIYRLNADSITESIDYVVQNENITSKVTIKAVLNNNSKFDFEGKLVVLTGAKNANLFLKISVLMLDNKSRSRVIPGLEIKENDVKAGHAATVGFLDKNQMNYLTSRGLSVNQATNLLVEGFIKS